MGRVDFRAYQGLKGLKMGHEIILPRMGHAISLGH